MKARIKATGEIEEVIAISDYINENDEWFITLNGEDQ